MKKTPHKKAQAEQARPKYDFSGGVRGKYADAIRAGSNLVLLDPELTQAFPDSDSVNQALHQLLAIARRAKDQKI